MEDMEIISSYSRAQAIEDGELVNISVDDSPFRSGGHALPMACTRAVYSIVDKGVKNKKHLNDLQGVLWDIHWMAHCYAKKDSDNFMFKVIITGTGRKRTHIFRAVLGGGDSGEPVITIMMPDED